MRKGCFLGGASFFYASMHRCLEATSAAWLPISGECVLSGASFYASMHQCLEATIAA
jgi:hypothetical protein